MLSLQVLRESARFAVLGGFIVLLAILAQTMAALPRHAVNVYVAVILRRALGLLASAVTTVTTFDESLVRPLAVLAFGVPLGAVLPTWLLAIRRHVLPRAAFGSRQVRQRRCPVYRSER